MSRSDIERVGLDPEKGGRPPSKGFFGLGEGATNPYSHYSTSEDGDSLDDGINMDERLENGDIQEADQMPPEDFVLREFYDYMEVMSPMSEPETSALNKTSLVEKWSLVYNQQCRSPIFPLRHYISSLRRHNDSRRRTFSWSRGSTDKDGVSKLAHLLRKLKADMKLSPLNFVDEFAEKTNDGVKMLLKVLAEIQSDKNSASTSRKQKNDEYKRAVTEEYDTLLCLKFLQRSQSGIFRFLELDGAIDAVVSVIYGDCIKSLAVALDILSNICRAVGGPSAVLRALADYSMKHGEFLRFKPLVSKLRTTSDQDVYSMSFMKLVNGLRAQERDPEAVVAMQYELHQADFDITDMHRVAQQSPIFGREIQKEIIVWDKSSIRVIEFAEEISNLQKRNAILKEEIDHLQSEIKAAGNRLDEVKKEKSTLEKKSEDYHSKATELIDNLEKLKSNSSDANQSKGENSSTTSTPLEPPAIDRCAPFRGSLKKSASSSPDDALSLNSFDSSASIPDAPPPPAPVPLPPKIQTGTKSNNHLPVLHWTPIYNVLGTVFQNVDNQLLSEGDFSEFEEKFKVVDKVPEKFTRKLSDDRPRVAVIDANRAKNLQITLRRFGKGPEEICEAIDTCDGKVLSGDDVELLSKFNPTKEETNLMLQHKDILSTMGEAEQFMFQMSQIERLDSKLSVLVSMGSLTQQLQLLKPKIANIHESVRSVKKNSKLQKILEIVLIFGNYMNSGKKGYAMGYKLESLSKLNSIKGRDNLTMMQFLVDFLQRRHPDLVDFYLDLDIGQESFQAVVTEMQDLKKNMAMIQQEKSLQTGNQELQKFAAAATQQMSAVGELFRPMETAYKEVCNMYGESYKEADSDGKDVLVHINEFADNFKKAFNELHQETDGQRTPVDRSAPPTPQTQRSPANAIAAMLQQSEKFNQRAEIARKESQDNLEALAEQSDPKGTLKRKNRAPQPPPVPSPKHVTPPTATTLPNVQQAQPVANNVLHTQQANIQQTKPIATKSPNLQPSVQTKPVANNSPNVQQTKPVANNSPNVQQAKPVANNSPNVQQAKPIATTSPTVQPSQQTKPVANISPSKQTKPVANNSPNVQPSQPVKTFVPKTNSVESSSPASGQSNIRRSSANQIEAQDDAASPNESVVQRAKMLFSSMDNVPSGRSSPVTPTAATKSPVTTPADVNAPRRSSTPGSGGPGKATSKSTPETTSQMRQNVGPTVSPKPPVTPSNGNPRLSKDNKTQDISQVKLSPVKNGTPPGTNQNVTAASPGGRMVFPAKRPAQNTSSPSEPKTVANSHKAPSPGAVGPNAAHKISPKHKAPEPPAKMTPTFNKKMPSPNLSDVLPNKTSPANFNRKLQRSDAVTSPPANNNNKVPSPTNATVDSSSDAPPSQNVTGLVRRFSKEEKEPPNVIKRTPPTSNPSPASQSNSPSPSQSPLNTSGKVIRKNSILFSAKSSGGKSPSPVTPQDKPKQSQSSSPSSAASSSAASSSAASSRRSSLEDNPEGGMVKNLMKDFERKSSMDGDVAKTMNEFDKALKDTGVAHEIVSSYL